MPNCPRCGAPFKSIHYKTIGGRVYALAYHGKRENGQPDYCYLGPAHGYSVAAELKAIHLAGLHEESFAEVVSLLESVMFRRRREAQGAEGSLERAEIWRKTLEDLEHLREVVENYIKEARSEHERWLKEAEREREEEERELSA